VPRDETLFFSEFYGRFLSGALHGASARGWGVQICTLKREPGRGFREAIQQLGLDSSGIIYLAETLTQDDVAELAGYSRPLVLMKAVLPLGVAPADLDVPVVGVDNFSGASVAAELLVQLGHRRVGLLLGPARARDAAERRQGYLTTLAAAGIRPRPEWIREGDFSVEAGRNAMRQLLRLRERPTALCCANDQIAFGAIDAVHDAGLRCPEDISIIGFDDSIWARACRPPLTTVQQPLAEMAERSVSLIIELAASSGRKRQPLFEELAAPLKLRASTRPVPAD
jgi:DNA-binding LacI/PurR family transcriptional regulator